MAGICTKVVLFLSLICIAASARLPQEEGQEVGEGVVADSSIHGGIMPVMGMGAPSRFSVSVPNELARAKRYIGWGRRPGMRYSKASSAFDFDTSFNKIYNKYEKREHPISSFRELRMKQKVPNAQVLLPHLFNRNNRGEAEGEGGLTDLNDEDIETLMYLLEEIKNSRNEP